jgi:hypothetical protein
VAEVDGAFGCRFRHGAAHAAVIVVQQQPVAFLEGGRACSLARSSTELMVPLVPSTAQELLLQVADGGGFADNFPVGGEAKQVIGAESLHHKLPAWFFAP